ncbi:hypothetical protein C9J27_06200 [Photobacterium kishitanii]|uniref:Uncharacterized protein n=1 Tax=Photobacterium kishitanii TaxID=318456 RepID=A0A2T3KM60_9GAMM|nr:hypothetical protein C9J27_06200 [Photobacterium kishitanii]
MVLDINSFPVHFKIFFKADDLRTEDNKECVKAVCHSLAMSYCFDADKVYCDQFKNFLDTCESGNDYFVFFDHDNFLTGQVKAGESCHLGATSGH